MGSIKIGNIKNKESFLTGTLMRYYSKVKKNEKGGNTDEPGGSEKRENWGRDPENLCAHRRRHKGRYHQ